MYDHSSLRYRGTLSCGAVNYVLFEVVLTFESVVEILKCDHAVESFCFSY